MFNLFTPGFEGTTHTTWLSKSMGESQLPIPILLQRLAGYFSQATLWEMMALMSAKSTQFSFPLCHSFPAIMIYNKPYIATITTFRIYTSHLYLVSTPRC